MQNIHMQSTLTSGTNASDLVNARFFARPLEFMLDFTRFCFALVSEERALFLGDGVQFVQ